MQVASSVTEHQRLSQREACAFAFLVAGCTLALQVLAHRVVSAKLLNNLAFLVIALTMLGFALSGVLLSGRMDEVQRRLRDRVGLWAAGAAAAMLVVTLALYRVDPGQQLTTTRLEFVRSFLVVIPVALLLAVPFTFCGLVLGALLAAPGVDARRVYGFDLLGSALGAVVVVPLIGALGVEAAVGLTCGALLAGAAVVARPRGRTRVVFAVC